MTTLEELTPGAVVRGVVPGEAVTVVASRWAGSRSVVLTFRTDAGRVDEQVVYRTQEAELTLDGQRRAWSFDGDGALFRLVAEARRIRLAYLFDPRLAVHLSLIEPLPHQIIAVYGEMLPRQPLALLPGRRPRRGQDDHGRALHQGADAARRPAPRPGRRSRRAGRPVAGRAARQVRARLLDPDPGADRGRPDR